MFLIYGSNRFHSKALNDQRLIPEKHRKTAHIQRTVVRDLDVHMISQFYEKDASCYQPY